MTFEVEVQGRVRLVSIEPIGEARPTAGSFRVHIADPAPNGAGAAYDVVLRTTDLGLVMVYAPEGRVVDAAVTPRGPGEWLIQLPHVDVRAVVDGRRLRQGVLDASAGSGAQRITAPMPGRIVRVLVQPGDLVEARQPVVVVEAMKMENELVAERPGRVADVAVSEGMSVEAGKLLVRIE